MASEREPLLGFGRQEEEQRSSYDEQASSAAPVRMLLALRAGYLPDNRQLNSLLSASASFFAVLSKAVLPPSSNKQYGATSTDGALSNETVITLAALLKECETLSRSLAQWVTGKASSNEQDNGVRGNANEQWQRAVWHVVQMFSSTTEQPVQVDTYGEGVQGGVREAVDSIGASTKQFVGDAKRGVKALAKMIALVLGSDELLRIPSDVVRSVEASLAAVAGDVSERAAKVERDLQPPTADREGAPNDDFLAPKDAFNEAFESATSAIDSASHSSEATQKGKGREERTLEEEAHMRFARLLDELRQEEVFRQAMNTFVTLTRKYMDIYKEVRDDVQAHVDGEADKGLDETLNATIESTHFDLGISAHLSHHATEAIQAIKEVLEGLAGGASLDVVLQRVEKLKEEVQSDSELRAWFNDALQFISASSVDVDKLKNANFDRAKMEEDIRRLHQRLVVLLETRPSVQRAWEDLRRSMDEFADRLRSNSDTRKLRARVQHILAMTKSVFVFGVQDAKHQTQTAISSLLQAVLPSLGEVLGSIPLPRVEFTSDRLDAALDDVHIGALHLIPDTVRFTTTQNWYWHRDVQAHHETEQYVDTDLRLTVGGLRLAVEHVSFYVQERFTAPLEDTCGSCCSFGHSQSDWCLFRGPSSWFAYTESALLDVGLTGMGAGITLDVRDAGQGQRRREDDKGDDPTADVREQFLVRDEEEEKLEQSARKTFFEINDCRVHVDDAFTFRLRNSRHWIINALVASATRPIVKLLLRRVIGAQLRNGFTVLDEHLYDVHRRAKIVSNRRSPRKSGTGERPYTYVDEVLPSMRDYIAVLLDDDAGKSKARLANERKERREREEEERKKEDEEAHERLHVTQQPRRTEGKSMEVKRAGVIMHDEDGEYSVAVGVRPEGLLLHERQRGPKTQRMRVREAMAHPQRTAREAAEYGKQIGKVSKDALFSDDQQVDDERDLLQAPRQTAQTVRRSMQAGQELLHGLVDPDEYAPEEKDDGWKSDAFNI